MLDESEVHSYTIISYLSLSRFSIGDGDGNLFLHGIPHIANPLMTSTLLRAPPTSQLQRHSTLNSLLLLVEN